MVTVRESHKSDCRQRVESSHGFSNFGETIVAGQPLVKHAQGQCLTEPLVCAAALCASVFDCSTGRIRSRVLSVIGDLVFTILFCSAGVFCPSGLTWKKAYARAHGRKRRKLCADLKRRQTQFERIHLKDLGSVVR